MSDYNPQDPAGPGAPMRWTSSSTHVPSPNVQATMHQMTEQLQTVIDAAERAAEAIRYDAEEQARRHLAEAQRKADRMTAERVGLISELTDDLVRHAANVRDHSEQMVRALEDAITSVTDKLEQPAMTDPFPSSEPPGPSLPFGEPIEAPPPGAGAIVDSGGYTDLVGDLPGGEPQPEPPPPPSPRTIPPPPPESPAPSGFEPSAPGRSARFADPPPAPERRLDTEQLDAGARVELSREAFQHATRLAIAGEDREMITNALRRWYGIDDPHSIVDRVMGRSQ